MAKYLFILFCTVVFFSCNSREKALAERDARLKQTITERMKVIYDGDRVDSVVIQYVDSASLAELLMIQKEPYLQDKNYMERQLPHAEELLHEYENGTSYMNKADAEGLKQDTEEIKNKLQHIAAKHDSMVRLMESEKAQEYAGFKVRVKYSTTSLYDKRSGEKIFLVDKNNKVIFGQEVVAHY